MDQLTHFEVVDGRGFYCPVGSMELSKLVEQITLAISHARVQGIRELLVNVHGLTGFHNPSLGERYFFIEKWASACGSRVRFALVVQGEMIDPEKFEISQADTLELQSHAADDAEGFVDRDWRRRKSSGNAIDRNIGFRAELLKKKRNDTTTEGDREIIVGFVFGLEKCATLVTLMDHAILDEQRKRGFAFAEEAIEQYERGGLNHQFG